MVDASKIVGCVKLEERFDMKNIRKLSFTIITAFVLVGGFYFSVSKTSAATGGGTATINVDSGAQGAGVTVIQSTSHTFKTVLTINVSGMTLGAASPTFTIPTGFTAPNLHAVATAGDVDVDGEWSVVAAAGSGVGGCTVDSAPGSALTVASGQTITVDITADCANGNIITLTYKGTSSVVMGATALTVRTADAGDPGPVTPLIAGSPTITVTSASATLNVIKHVITDNGGIAVASDFTMNVTGTNVSDPSFTGAEDPGTTITLDAGAYSVDEDAFSGYTKSLGADCSGTIAAGETETCTVTNDDIAPSLTLDKIVVNDNAGTALESEWTLTATGPTTLSGAGAAGSTDVVSGASFDQGTYTLSESTGPTGYTASTWSCTNGITVNGSSQITLGLGQSTVCTITNNDTLQSVSDDEEDNNEVDIKVTKKANPSALYSGPGSVTYTYKVTNEGDVSLINVSVKDDTCSPVEYVSGDSNHNDKLGVDEEWKYTCTKRVSQTETNTATVRGSGNGEEVKDTDTATVVVSVPGFPDVGVAPDDESSTLWNSITSTGIPAFLFLFSLT